jgi:hypothetical protein
MNQQQQDTGQHEHEMHSSVQTSFSPLDHWPAGVIWRLLGEVAAAPMDTVSLMGKGRGVAPASVTPAWLIKVRQAVPAIRKEKR